MCIFYRTDVLCDFQGSAVLLQAPTGSGRCVFFLRVESCSVLPGEAVGIYTLKGAEIPCGQSSFFYLFFLSASVSLLLLVLGAQSGDAGKSGLILPA